MPLPPRAHSHTLTFRKTSRRAADVEADARSSDAVHTRGGDLNRLIRFDLWRRELSKPRSTPTKPNPAIVRWLEGV
ncbi:hypothetical protein AArc1_2997 [Natrarchaeobaculum sulfurireducens]|uniref:Uncharacterized protein n=1 Tax=Natrarchaeobaculum sulfurireducens TaxID=2044521 RepID=A0A346PIG0_9EURY|nr:hypothetical protein AArc1_2997 [Natrarchaeobaculum sulfurireducens]